MTAYHPLLPDDEPEIVPVGNARTVARQLLAEYAATNIHDHNATVQAATALGTILRSLVTALDAERGDA
ncbi:hypothetical protein ABZ725_51565 [Streptomyces sp. NPDC006872]|uniref:hypothetical protein n=1 Tax=Streptomyces sp. NPDC006872 TaxID=3155720 RepID=UPI0033E56532